LAFAIGLLIFFGRPAETSTLADENSYAKAYQNYVDSTETYNKAHEDYVLKRAQYLRFKTQTSSTDALNSTITLLQARDQVVIDYLKTLKERLTYAKEVSDQDNAELNGKLDDEISWFADHRDKEPSASSLDDVVADSAIAKKEFDSLNGVIYKTLSVVVYGKTLDYQSRLNDILNSLKDKMAKIKSDQRQEYTFSADKLTTIDRWLYESQNHLDRSTEKQQAAETAITKIDIGKGLGGQPYYNSVLSNSNSSKQYIRETGTYLKEVIREIKTAE